MEGSNIVIDMEYVRKQLHLSLIIMEMFTRINGRK